MSDILSGRGVGICIASCKVGNASSSSFWWNRLVARRSGALLHFQVIHPLMDWWSARASRLFQSYVSIWLVAWKLSILFAWFYLKRTATIFYNFLEKTSWGGKLCYISTHFSSFCRFSLWSEVSWKWMSIYWCIIALASPHRLISRGTRSRIASCSR